MCGAWRERIKNSLGECWIESSQQVGSRQLNIRICSIELKLRNISLTVSTWKLFPAKGLDRHTGGEGAGRERRR